MHYCGVVVVWYLAASQGIVPRWRLHFTVAFSGQLLFLGKSAQNSQLATTQAWSGSLCCCFAQQPSGLPLSLNIWLPDLGQMKGVPVLIAMQRGMKPGAMLKISIYGCLILNTVWVSPFNMVYGFFQIGSHFFLFLLVVIFSFLIKKEIGRGSIQVMATFTKLKKHHFSKIVILRLKVELLLCSIKISLTFKIMYKTFPGLSGSNVTSQ